MTEKPTTEQKERLRKLIDMVLEEDALTLVDESAILDICVNAAKRKEAELTEEMLMERLGRQ